MMKRPGARTSADTEVAEPQNAAQVAEPPVADPPVPRKRGTVQYMQGKILANPDNGTYRVWMDPNSRSDRRVVWTNFDTREAAWKAALNIIRDFAAGKSPWKRRKLAN